MKRVLLIGAGHAHLGVLAEFGRRPLPGVHMTLVTPYAQQIYSGMLPGWIAGHYRLEQCAIAVEPVALRAQAQLCLGQVVQLDLSQRRALTAQGQCIEFDVVSINIGSAPPIAGAFVGSALRPIESFIEAWSLLRRQRAPAQITVVGGGAAGVEVVLAMAWRLAQEGAPTSLRLIAGSRGVLPTMPLGVRQRVRTHLQMAGVHVVDEDMQGLAGNALQLASGQALHSDWTVLATGSAAAPWPRQAGLNVDTQGFIQTEATLQASSHPFVFAAGDCAQITGATHARSGVYAVRAGPTLAHNLRAVALGHPLKPHAPQKRALYLLATGARHALASWGGMYVEGDWVWRWKDRIDRAFIARYAQD